MGLYDSKFSIYMSNWQKATTDMLSPLYIVHHTHSISLISFDYVLFHSIHLVSTDMQTANACCFFVTLALFVVERRI